MLQVIMLIERMPTPTSKITGNHAYQEDVYISQHVCPGYKAQVTGTINRVSHHAIACYGHQTYLVVTKRNVYYQQAWHVKRMPFVQRNTQPSAPLLIPTPFLYPLKLGYLQPPPHTPHPFLTP